MRMANKPYRKPPAAAPGSKDSFSREEFVTLLHVMTGSVSYPLVLAIDGQWGSGKTHLLETWGLMLKEQNRPHLNFNAWAHDHSDDPFVSFLGMVRGELPALLGDEKKVLSFVKKAAEAFPGVLNQGAKIAVNLACNKLGFSPDIIDGSSFVDAAQKQIELYKAHHDSIDAFRKELESAAVSIGEKWLNSVDREGDASSIERPPLLILVDELDRCRPDFAVKLLERVKHLFSVPGVVFVFGVDMTQLRESARCLYGQDMDSDGYYRRFFDLVIPMPAPNRDQRAFYCRNLVSALGTTDVADGPRESDDAMLGECLQWIGAILGMTLRDLAQAAAFSDLVLRSVVGVKASWRLVYFLVVLRMKRNDIFEKVVSASVDAKDISSLLPMNDDNLVSNETGFNYICIAVRDLFVGLYHEDKIWDEFSTWTKTLSELNLGRLLMDRVIQGRLNAPFNARVQVLGIANSIAVLVAAPSSRDLVR